MTRFFYGLRLRAVPARPAPRSRPSRPSAPASTASRAPTTCSPGGTAASPAHTWPWLGASGQATERLPLGTGVTPTGARYHPALIAQAWMTLERLFPGRLFLGIGSGEALNEVPVGDDWPSPGDQIARMDEALPFIRRLWDGETITEEGRFYRCEDCKLHTLADRRPPIWVSRVRARRPRRSRRAAATGSGRCPTRSPRPAVLEAWRADAAATARSCSRRCSRGRRPTRRRWRRRASGRARSRRSTTRDDWHEPATMYEHGEEQMSDDEFLENAIIGADPERARGADPRARGARRDGDRAAEQLGRRPAAARSRSTASRCCPRCAIPDVDKQ